ncbi:MAG: hypothetical protein IPJ81_04480 [Chitinophagaceae bacterium]|nr:hypothetical protein [Chitinophagaceae bacterium]
MKKLKLFLAVAVIALTVASCGKGDKGDKGDTGATGAPGAPGQQGPIGQTGSANVKAFIFTGPQLTWPNALNAQRRFNLTLPASVAQADLDNGLVLTYMKVGNAHYQVPDFVSNLGKFVRLFRSNKTLTFTAMNEDFTTVTTGDLDEASEVKVMVIPPGAAPTVINGKSAVDFSDYKATMKYFGLPE